MNQRACIYCHHDGDTFIAEEAGYWSTAASGWSDTKPITYILGSRSARWRNDALNTTTSVAARTVEFPATVTTLAASWNNNIKSVKIEQMRKDRYYYKAPTRKPTANPTYFIPPKADARLGALTVGAVFLPFLALVLAFWAPIVYAHPNWVSKGWELVASDDSAARKKEMARWPAPSYILAALCCTVFIPIGAFLPVFVGLETDTKDKQGFASNPGLLLFILGLAWWLYKKLQVLSRKLSNHTAIEAFMLKLDLVNTGKGIAAAVFLLLIVGAFFMLYHSFLGVKPHSTQYGVYLVLVFGSGPFLLGGFGTSYLILLSNKLTRQAVFGWFVRFLVMLAVYLFSAILPVGLITPNTTLQSALVATVVFVSIFILVFGILAQCIMKLKAGEYDPDDGTDPEEFQDGIAHWGMSLACCGCIFPGCILIPLVVTDASFFDDGHGGTKAGALIGYFFCLLVFGSWFAAYILNSHYGNVSEHQLASRGGSVLLEFLADGRKRRPRPRRNSVVVSYNQGHHEDGSEIYQHFPPVKVNLSDARRFYNAFNELVQSSASSNVNARELLETTDHEVKGTWGVVREWKNARVKGRADVNGTGYAILARWVLEFTPTLGGMDISTEELEQAEAKRLAEEELEERGLAPRTSVFDCIDCVKGYFKSLYVGWREREYGEYEDDEYAAYTRPSLNPPYYHIWTHKPRFYSL